MKQQISIFMSSLLLSIIVFTSCSQPINWDENDFGAYFGFDTFDLSIDDIVQMEKEQFNITDFERKDEDYGIFLTFWDGDDIRHYKFYKSTEKLFCIEYTLEKKNLYAKFKKAFGEPCVKDNFSFWYGHIAEQQITIASRRADEWNPWIYEISVPDPPL